MAARRGGPLRIPIAETAGWGALAYSNSTGRFGYAYGLTDRQSAEQNARANCLTADATVICWGKEVYIAFVASDAGAYGSAWDADPKLAEAKAFEYGREYDKNCRLLLLFHTRRGTG
jgi:hypothetical protein